MCGALAYVCVLLQAFDDLNQNFKINSQLLLYQKFIGKGGYGQVDRMMLLKVKCDYKPKW